MIIQPYVSEVNRADLVEAGGKVVARQYNKLNAAHGEQTRPHQFQCIDQTSVV